MTRYVPPDVARLQTDKISDFRESRQIGRPQRISPTCERRFLGPYPRASGLQNEKLTVCRKQR